MHLSTSRTNFEDVYKRQGTYTKQTFGKDRYTIWTMQSNYHNLPMINGVPQKFGQE